MVLRALNLYVMIKFYFISYVRLCSFISFCSVYLLFTSLNINLSKTRHLNADCCNLHLQAFHRYFHEIYLFICLFIYLTWIDPLCLLKQPISLDDCPNIKVDRCMHTLPCRGKGEVLCISWVFYHLGPVRPFSSGLSLQQGIFVHTAGSRSSYPK